jgi:SAM-dependent methyltransferase
MTERDFSPIADSLRHQVLDFYNRRGEELSDAAGLNTLETNSGYVERRGEPLLQMLRANGGPESIAGLDLLDLGCGFGGLSAYFAALGATVTAIDPNEARFEVGRAVAAEHGLALEFKRGSMQELDLPDAGFDVAVANNSLCYVIDRDDRRAALTESLRVLRPGGFLIVRNPNRWNPMDQFTGLPLLQLLPPERAVATASRLGHDRSLVRLASPAEAVRELRAAGFEAVTRTSPPERGRPRLLEPFARYQHLIGRRPS